MDIFVKAFKILTNSFEQHVLLQGISDIIVVKWKSGQIYSTPLLVCFGPSTSIIQRSQVKVYINDQLIQGVKFSLDEYGYIHPMKPSTQLLKKLNLSSQRNKITFQLNEQHRVSSQIYLYDENDKILVSDVDGTLTKNDLGGFYNNYTGENFLHDGYYELIETLDKKKVKILWLTMRPLALYQFTKQYVSKHTSVHGPLLTQPQQLLAAMKKQVFKKTSTVKTNMLKTIRQLFPQDAHPFIAGLGNRDNDAIAYLAAGINQQDVFIIDTQSTVHHFGDPNKPITYKQMCQSLGRYFQPELPKLNKTLTFNMIDMGVRNVQEQNNRLKKHNSYI